MKNLFTLLCIVCFYSATDTIAAQESMSVSDINNPIYDRADNQLRNTDTIPDYRSKTNKLKLTGIIYQSDGVTPAKDVILYVSQPDENGDFQMKRDEHRKRYVHHQGWIKTDADGRYTLYTFMPGKYLYAKELKKIHRVIKEPGKPEYEINSFFFNDDPLIPELTLACRAQAVPSMLRLEKEGDMLVATKDIKLNKSIKDFQ